MTRAHLHTFVGFALSLGLVSADAAAQPLTSSSASCQPKISWAFLGKTDPKVAKKILRRHTDNLIYHGGPKPWLDVRAAEAGRGHGSMVRLRVVPCSTFLLRRCAGRPKCGPGINIGRGGEEPPHTFLCVDGKDVAGPLYLEIANGWPTKGGACRRCHATWERCNRQELQHAYHPWDPGFKVSKVCKAFDARRCIERRCSRAWQVEGHVTGFRDECLHLESGDAADGACTGGKPRIYQLHLTRARPAAAKVPPKQWHRLMLPGGSAAPRGSSITTGPRWALFNASFALGDSKAARYLERLRDKGYTKARIVDSRLLPCFWCCFHVVLVERFDSRAEALVRRRELGRRGLRGLRVKQIY